MVCKMGKSMRKMTAILIGIFAFECHSETITLPSPPFFSETDVSHLLNLPQTIAPGEYFRVAIGTIPENAQVVVALGSDLNGNGTLDAEEVETALDSDEADGFRLPNGIRPSWNTVRITLRGGNEPVAVRVGVSAPALKIMLY